MFFDKTLIGVDAIAWELGVDSKTTSLTDWFIHDYLPMQKMHGQWCASKRELAEWKEQHAELFAPPKVIFVRVKIKPPRPRRWGF